MLTRTSPCSLCGPTTSFLAVVLAWLVLLSDARADTPASGDAARASDLDGAPSRAEQPGPSRSASGDQGPMAVATVVLGTDARVDEGETRDRDEGKRESDQKSLLHGFRLGYVFVANHERPIDAEDEQSSLAKRHDLRSPHMFLLGYELAHRMTGSGWLNVLLIGNVSLTGLEQSKAFPSANLLLGFELDEAFQMGVGVNLAPVDDKPAHLVLAAGWTPSAGDIYLPLHVFFMPDIDRNHRFGATLGVNWAL